MSESTISSCVDTRQNSAYRICSTPTNFTSSTLYYGYTTVAAFNRNSTCSTTRALTSGDKVYGLTPGATFTATIGTQSVTLTAAGGRAVVGRDCDPIENICSVKRLAELRLRIQPTTILGVSLKDIEISSAKSITLDAQGRVPAGGSGFHIRATAGTEPVYTSFVPQSPMRVTAVPTTTTFSLSGTIDFRMQSPSGSVDVHATPNVTGDSRIRSVARGDVDGDGRSDILLAGGAEWTTIPGALSNGDGSFTAFVNTQIDFASWAATFGVVPLGGDFDGDGLSEVALTGGAGWSTIPVAFSNGNSTFRITNAAVTNFPFWATSPGAKIVSGDFDGDGRTDLAISGPSGWTTIPVAFSSGDGGFRVSNMSVTTFPGWAATPGAKLLSGDFNADGRTDLALTGVVGWTTIPMALSNGDGTFRATVVAINNFPGWATTSGAKFVTGDFNGDRYTDIAITGPPGWGSVPMALSNGSGGFLLANVGLADFPWWASLPGVKPVAGDFDGDGRGDIALTGGGSEDEPSTTVPVAFSNGNGSFHVSNMNVNFFPTWGAEPGAKVVVGH